MTRYDMTDRIMSVAAIVAAIAAVLVAAYEARINREYQRISVWPRIQQSNSFVVGDPTCASRRGMSARSRQRVPAIVSSFSSPPAV